MRALVRVILNIYGLTWHLYRMLFCQYKWGNYGCFFSSLPKLSELPHFRGVTAFREPQFMTNRAMHKDLCKHVDRNDRGISSVFVRCKFSTWIFLRVATYTCASAVNRRRFLFAFFFWTIRGKENKIRGFMLLLWTLLKLFIKGTGCVSPVANARPFYACLVCHRKRQVIKCKTKREKNTFLKLLMHEHPRIQAI